MTSTASDWEKCKSSYLSQPLYSCPLVTLFIFYLYSWQQRPRRSFWRAAKHHSSACVECRHWSGDQFNLIFWHNLEAVPPLETNREREGKRKKKIKRGSWDGFIKTSPAGKEENCDAKRREDATCGKSTINDVRDSDFYKLISKTQHNSKVLLVVIFTSSNPHSSRCTRVSCPHSSQKNKY